MAKWAKVLVAGFFTLTFLFMCMIPFIYEHPFQTIHLLPIALFYGSVFWLVKTIRTPDERAMLVTEAKDAEVLSPGKTILIFLGVIAIFPWAIIWVLYLSPLFGLHHLTVKGHLFFILAIPLSVVGFYTTLWRKLDLGRTRIAVDDGDNFKPLASQAMSQNDENDLVEYRRSLLPSLMKSSGWLFIVMGVLATSLALVLPEDSSNQGYVFNYDGWRIEFGRGVLITIAIPFIVLAISAYGLLFGKTWGLKVGTLTGYAVLAILCLISIATMNSWGWVVLFGFIIPMAFYVMSLHKIGRKGWINGSPTK